MYFKRLILAAMLALSAGIADAQFMAVTPAGGSITPGKLTGCAASTLLYSDAASLLQCSATIPFAVTVVGNIFSTNAGGTSGNIFIGNGGPSAWNETSFLLTRSRNAVIGFAASNATGAGDTLLTSDAANTLAQRNGANAQLFNIYNSYTDAANNEVLAIGSTGANRFKIGTDKAGTGTQRSLDIWGSDISFKVGTGGGSTVLQATSSSLAVFQNFIFNADNTNDIGASGANRPRNVFVAGTVTVGSTTLLTSSVALTNGAAAALGTLTNAPAAGNPTKWIPINDNGTTRYVPSW